MPRFVQHGDVVPFTAAADLAAGAIVVAGDLVGMNTHPVKSGEVGALQVEGVIEVNKLSTDNATVGVKLYWDATNARATTTASSHKLLGYAVVAAGNGVANVLAKLVHI